jgi:hypothetical protein
MKFATLFLAVFLLSSIKAQPIVDLECEFRNFGFGYACHLFHGIVPNDQNVHVKFIGTHEAGRGDQNVRRMTVMYGNIPFILPQYFTTFTNLETLEMDISGLVRIQAGAFKNAGNLETIFIHQTPLAIIEPNAFVGASKLTGLALKNNLELKRIDENIFNGLEKLRALDLSSNGINSINVNAFRPLTSLSTIYLSYNSLTSLDVREL